MCSSCSYDEQNQPCEVNSGMNVPTFLCICKLYDRSCITLCLFVFQQKLPHHLLTKGMPYRGLLTLVLGLHLKLVSTYCIFPKSRRITINGWAYIMILCPNFKIGDIFMFMLYQGTLGLFLFIDAITSWMSFEKTYIAFCTAAPDIPFNYCMITIICVYMYAM